MNAIAGGVGFLQPPTTRSWRDAAQLPPLSVDDRDGVAVVSLCGELDFSDASVLHACLTDIRWQARELCVADLSGLAFLGCACLGVLVGHCKRVRGRGGSFALAGPQPAVLRILSATGLLTWFEVYETVEEAITGAGLRRKSPGLLAAGALGSPAPARPRLVDTTTRRPSLNLRLGQGRMHRNGCLAGLRSAPGC
jgi:anti-sigma B factor antagonist